MATPKSNSSESWSGYFDAGNTQVAIDMEATGGGITSCRLREHTTLRRKPDATPKPLNAHLADAIKQLREYFAGKRDKFELTLSPAGTPFQQKVWKAARAIPHGQTRSYWWIAVRIGDPKAMRA